MFKNWVEIKIELNFYLWLDCLIYTFLLFLHIGHLILIFSCFLRVNSKTIITELISSQFNLKQKIIILILIFLDIFLKFMDYVELFINKSSPVLTGLFCLVSVYWCCLSYGFITCVQVVIHLSCFLLSDIFI